MTTLVYVSFLFGAIGFACVIFFTIYCLKRSLEAEALLLKVNIFTCQFYVGSHGLEVHDAIIAREEWCKITVELDEYIKKRKL